MAESNDLKLVDYFSWLGDQKKFVEGFDCGIDKVNKQIKLVVEDKDSHRLLLLVDNKFNVYGFIAYSLATTQLIQSGESPLSKFPVLNIDLLGIEKNVQKNGYGTWLISKIFKLAITIDTLIPLTGVHLEAVEDAVEFYEKLGFKDLGSYYPGREQTQMFLNIDSLRQSNITVYQDPFNLKD